MSHTNKPTLEHIIGDKTAYIGEDIPETLADDVRPKFVVLGTPEQLIQAILKWHEEECARQLQTYKTEQEIEGLAIHCPEGKCKSCDYKRPKLEQALARLKSLKEHSDE